MIKTNNVYAVAQVQPIHVTQPLSPLRERIKTMFPNDIINRVYENDKTSGLTLMFMNTCLSNLGPEQKITPEYIEDVYGKLHVLAKKISEQIETSEKSNREKYRLEPIKEAVCSTSSSPSFGMRRAKH